IGKIRWSLSKLSTPQQIDYYCYLKQRDTKHRISEDQSRPESTVTNPIKDDPKNMKGEEKEIRKQKRRFIKLQRKNQVIQEMRRNGRAKESTPTTPCRG